MNNYPPELIEQCLDDLFDCAVNPLAEIMCNFFALQVQKGYLTKDEAKFQIASGVEAINRSQASGQAREFGGDLLMRMIVGIDHIELKEN